MDVYIIMVICVQYIALLVGRCMCVFVCVCVVCLYKVYTHMYDTLGYFQGSCQVHYWNDSYEWGRDYDLSEV